MKRRSTVVGICFGVSFLLSGTFILGADRDTAAERQCAVRFGTSGAALPALIREAIKVFPKDRYPLRPDQVVYITDFSGFVDCMGITSEATRNYLFRQELMVFHNDFPIYFNANEDAVNAFRSDGRDAFLKYFYAAFIGNGWIHATGEKKDYPAYAFELSLLQSYKKRLPAGDMTDEHFAEVRGFLEEAKFAEQKSVTVVRTSRTH